MVSLNRRTDAAVRSNLALIAALLASVIVVAVLLPAGARAAGPTTGDDGLFKQDWFHESFLDLKEDLSEAAGDGKGLLIAFEQAGCPYCREMHKVNLADREIVGYLRKHFTFVQLDLRGSREVTDFDGKVMEERELARRWGIVFTPTLLLFERSAKPSAGKPGKAIASAVMPGYFKPFHFRTMLEFVAEGHFKTKHFQAYITERATRLRAEGKKVKIW